MTFRAAAWLSLAFAAPLGLLMGCKPRESLVDAGVRTQTLHLGNGAEPQDLDPQVCTA